MTTIELPAASPRMDGTMFEQRPQLLAATAGTGWRGFLDLE
ncbi:hypothetical protein [Bradyrhizobium manausense]|nr:hypothetical protein [Bradyrhizobium manausense]